MLSNLANNLNSKNNLGNNNFNSNSVNTSISNNNNNNSNALSQNTLNQPINNTNVITSNNQELNLDRLESSSSVNIKSAQIANADNISPHVKSENLNASGPPSKRTKLTPNPQNSVKPEDNSDNELVVDEDATNNSSLTSTTQNSNLTSNVTNSMPNLQPKAPTLPNLAGNNSLNQWLQFPQALAKNGNPNLPLGGLPGMPSNPPGIPQIGQGNPNLGLLGNPALQNLLENAGGINHANPLLQGALANFPGLANNPLAALQALQNNLNLQNLPHPNPLASGQPNQLLPGNPNQLPNLQASNPQTFPSQSYVLKIGKNKNIIGKEFPNKMRVENLYNNPNLANKLPRNISTVKVFNHKEVVCAVTINVKSKQVLTGGKGVVKIWDLSKEINSDSAETLENQSKPGSVGDEKLENSEKGSKSGSDKDEIPGSRASSRVETLKQESRENSRPGSRCSLKEGMDLCEDKFVYGFGWRNEDVLG